MKEAAAVETARVLGRELDRNLALRDRVVNEELGGR